MYVSVLVNSLSFECCASLTFILHMCVKMTYDCMQYAFIACVAPHSKEEAAFICICDTGAWVSEGIYEWGNKEGERGKRALKLHKAVYHPPVVPDNLSTS